MPSGSGAADSGMDKVVRAFVIEVVEAQAMRTDGPKTINITRAFAQFLEERRGHSELEASEVAAKQVLLVRRQVGLQIGRWSDQGISPPMNFTVENEDIVVSWRHPRYEALTGYQPAQAQFVKIYDWVGAQAQRAFLIPCIWFLKAIDCDPIFITDGARDEGIDCIGLINRGPLRSTAFFVQARSKSDLISGEPLQQEYAKYAALPRTSKYMAYLNALGTPGSKDGAGYLYCVLTNSDFKFAAQQQASRLGVLLRSRRQLAEVLSRHFTHEQLQEIAASIPIPAAGDLTTNVAPLIPLRAPAEEAA
jgi:hypothetical protein